MFKIILESSQNPLLNDFANLLVNDKKLQKFVASTQLKITFLLDESKKVPSKDNSDRAVRFAHRGSTKRCCPLCQTSICGQGCQDSLQNIHNSDESHRQSFLQNL